MAKNIQLGNLDHEEIKQSIIDFIKNERSTSASSIKDYNFEGSALNSLLDILSYNTLYYGFYANMVANEIFLDTAQKVESIISLVKPLGYVVPGYSSAVAEIKIDKGGAYNTIPKYSSFIGKNENGSSFIFYTLENYELNDQGDAIFEVYEGKNLVVTETNVDSDTGQKIFLSGLDIDISTITVEVEGVEWSLSSNIASNITDTSKVYWLERSDLGFYVVFGGLSASGTTEQSGANVDEGDIIKITYLVSSGENGNNVGSFVTQNLYQTNTVLSTNHNIITRKMSSEGNNNPDLDSIKFFAPKWFAAQDRAVTKNDCKSVLGTLGYDPEKTSVWGGEEMVPPQYGRVFVSIINDLGVDVPVDDAKSAINKLKDKMCISILPEFVPAAAFTTYVDMNVQYKSGVSNRTESQLRNIIEKYVNTNYNQVKFDNTFNLNKALSGIMSLDPAFSSFDLSQTNVRLRKTLNPSESKTTISLYNEIESDTSSGIPITSTSIGSTNIGDNVFIESSGSILRAFNYQGGLKRSLGTVGSVDYTRGIITVDPFFNESFTLIIRTKNVNEIKAMNNTILNIDFDLTLSSE